MKLIFIGSNNCQKSNSNELKTFSSAKFNNHSVVGSLGTCTTPRVHILSFLF